MLHASCYDCWHAHVQSYWQDLHQLFEKQHSAVDGLCVDLTMHNQDLSGFFVSILFYDVADEDLDEALKGVVVTVDLVDNLSVMKTICGRHCLLHDKRTALFLEAVKVLFKFSLFVVGGQAACHAAVSWCEHLFFSQCLLNFRVCWSMKRETSFWVSTWTCSSCASSMCSNRVDSDVLCRLFRMTTHMGDPFYETMLERICSFRD